MSDTGVGRARTIIMKADVAEDDFTGCDRAFRRSCNDVVHGQFAPELDKLRIGREHAHELLQCLAHLHCRPGDAGKDQKHRQDDGCQHAEDDEADKGDESADGPATTVPTSRLRFSSRI